MQDRQLHRSLRSHRSDLLGEIAGVLDFLAVNGGDDVTSLDTGLLRRTVRLRLGNQRALPPS